MIKKPKILFLIDTLQTGGAEKSLVEMSIHQDSFIPVFVSLYQGNELADTLKQNNIKVIEINCKKKYGFNTLKKKLIPIINTIQPDIIHSTLFRSNIISRKLKNTFPQIPIVNSFVSNSYHQNRFQLLNLTSKIKLNLIKFYDRLTINKVDFIISNSETIKQDNARILGYPLSKIKVIYRGRNPEKYSVFSQNSIEKLKQEFNLKNEKIFLNVGRLTIAKAQKDLINAYAQTVKDFQNTKLLIAGEGPERKNLENLIARNRLQDKVLLLGNRKDIAELLQLADFFVHTSHYEGLPGVLIEAMFAEKIIISSDIPENMECVSKNEALIFEKGNIKDLSRQMIKVLEHPNEFTNLGKQAKKTAYEKFTIDKVIEQYAETYNQLIKNFRQ